MFFPYPLYISHSTTPHYRYFCICNPARCSCTCIITLFNWTEQLPAPPRNAEIDQFSLNSTWMQSVNHTSLLINIFDWRPASMRLCVCNLAAALARARVHTSRLHCVGRMPRMCTVSSFCITSRRSSSSSSLTHPLPLHVFRFRTSWTTSCSRHQFPDRECAHHSPGDRYSETCTSLQESSTYC